MLQQVGGKVILTPLDNFEDDAKAKSCLYLARGKTEN